MQLRLDECHPYYVVPAAELDAMLDWLVSCLVDKSPIAIRSGKYVMRAIDSMSIDESIAYAKASSRFWR